MVCQHFLETLERVILGLSIFFILFSSPVWSGFACLENPCFHGICIDYLDINSSHQCYCRNGFTGYSCQINWDECRSNPCLNGGVCTDGIASFNCSCPENFAGAFCQYDLSACDEIFPCQNNGTCTVDPSSTNGTFMCNCPPGFSGPQCESDVSVCNITENVCRNGGRCVDGLGMSFHCECESGWSGITCEVEVDECESQPCQNGGICVDKVNDFSCACPFGYTGKACESKLKICEDNPCLNGAFCLHEDVDDAKLTCYCVPDYHGTLCEFKYNDCDPPPKCFNGGSCIDGVGDFSCSCPPFYFGKSCQCTLDNMTHPECQFNDTVIIPSASEVPWEFPKTLDGTITWIPPTMTSLFQLSPTVVIPSPSPSSTIIQGEDLTSSHAKPLGSAIILSSSVETSVSSSLVFQSERHSIIHPSSMVVTNDSSEIVTAVLHPPSLSMDLQSTAAYFSPTLPIQETELMFQSPASLSSSPLPLLSSPVVLVDSSESEEVNLLSASLLLSKSIQIPHIISSEIPSDSVSFSSPIYPVLTISEVIYQSASVPVDMSSLNSLIPGESSVLLMSSSYESDIPEKDIVSGGISLTPSLSLSIPPVIESEKMFLSSPLEMSPTYIMMSSGISFDFITVSSSLLMEVSSDSSQELISPTPTSLLMPTAIVTTLLEPSSPSIEETLSFNIMSSKEELFPSSTFTFDEDILSLSSAIMMNGTTGGGFGESAGVTTAFENEIIPSSLLTMSVSQFPPEHPVTLTLIKPTATAPLSSLSHLESVLSPLVPYPSSSLILVSTVSSNLVGEPYQTISFNGTMTTTESVTPEDDTCAGYCSNGAKCISNSIRPECICTFKFEGDRCEIPREKFNRVSFTGDSFIGYKVPNESINRIEVGVKVATNFPEGILLYTSVEKLYALIFLQDGHVTLHFSCGEQSMHFVETRTKVDNGFNFTVEFNMELIVRGAKELHCVGQVKVNDSYIMRGEQTLNLQGPHDNPMQMVYLGGVPASSDAIRNDELIGIISGFRGCLYTLSVNQEVKDLFDDAVEAQEVSDCSTFECASNPCYGTAKCIPSSQFPFWQCHCPPGFEGVKCQIRVCDMKNPCQNGATCTYPALTDDGASFNASMSAVCLCPLGFSGQLCQSKINITKPSFKPTLGFDYSAFIAYEPIPRLVDWLQLKFHFVTPNVTQVALLFYSGFHQNHDGDLLSENYSDLGTDPQEPSHFADSFPDLQSSEPGGSNSNHRKIADFFALTFVHGYITLTWNLGSGTQRIITPGRIDKRLNVHTLFAGRSGRQAWLKVDGMRNVSGKSPGPFHRLNVNSELFVGGHEAFRFEGLPHDLPLHKGFHGCIFDFGFRVKNRLYLPRATRGRNVQNCYEEDC